MNIDEAEIKVRRSSLDAQAPVTDSTRTADRHHLDDRHRTRSAAQTFVRWGHFSFLPGGF